MYVSLFFGGKKIDRLALQDLRADDSFLTWICRITMTIKTLRGSAPPVKHFSFKSFALNRSFGLPGSNVFVFHFCFSFLFLVWDNMGLVISFPVLALNLGFVLWRMEVSQ